jgi:hypothetical protein
MSYYHEIVRRQNKNTADQQGWGCYMCKYLRFSGDTLQPRMRGLEDLIGPIGQLGHRLVPRVDALEIGDALAGSCGDVHELLRHLGSVEGGVSERC